MAIANKENEGGEEQMIVKAHGSIVSIVFHNFLTYDDVVCRPGPYLNVIIGPNGTGKSTIICGICLAVGGSPKVLGRSDQFGDFIKHGKETGYVELHLYDKNVKSTRIFKISLHRPNSPRYSINGKAVTREEHCKSIAQYNIQVDNPCTFLAQDKVKSFAEQDPKQLLKNTEKAGPTVLLRMHGELEQFFREGETIRARLVENRKRYEALQQNVKTLKVRADNFREREKQHFKIKLLKKRRVLTRYEKCIDSQKAAIKSMNMAKADLNKARDALKPLEVQMAKTKKDSDQMALAATNASNRQKDNLRKIDDLLATTSFEDKLAENASEFAQVKRQYDTWETEKSRITLELESVNTLWEKAKLENNEPNEEFEQRRRTLMEASQRLKDFEREVRQERSQLLAQKDELQRQVDAQQQVFRNKLQDLAHSSRNRGIIEAWQFYNRNREQFRFPVYVPFLHMVVKNDKGLLYLNNTIGKRDLSIFIFGCREDEEKLLGGENRYRINSTVVDQYLSDSYRNPLNLPNHLKERGFTEFVSELFDAPSPVRAYLCSVHQLHRIPIGDAQVDNECEKIAQEIGKEFGLFLTNKSRVSVIFSKYSKASYVKRSVLNAHQGILCSDQTHKLVDFTAKFQQLQEIMRENEEKHKVFQSDRAEFEEKLKEFRSEEKAIGEKKNAVLLLEDKVNRFKRRLQDFSKQKPNIEMAANAFEERKRILAAEAISDLGKISKLLESQRTCLLNAFLASAESSRLRSKLNELREEFENLEANTREYQHVYEEKMREAEAMRSEICAKKKEFISVCEFPPSQDPDSVDFSSKEKDMLRKLKKAFEEYKIPDAEDEVEQQIADEYNRLEIGRMDGSRKDVEEYRTLCNECEDIEAVVLKDQGLKEKWNEEMDGRLDAWLNPLKALIEKINENYTRFFDCLGCAGHIELKEAEDKYNINEYGIVIYVKFRQDTKLRPLTHQTQSGGERSVATMLYLMALQDLCPVPFRCVDEINQGMDPDNERRVFNMMVRLLSSEGEVAKTQYFLLTPKLLGGLQFNNRVTIHVVHNGPTMKNAEAWDPEKFLRSLA